VNVRLERVRELLRQRSKLVREAFDVADSDHDGCLTHLQAVGLARSFIKGTCCVACACSNLSPSVPLHPV
jgi:hypothetical protein